MKRILSITLIFAYLVSFLFLTPLKPCEAYIPSISAPSACLMDSRSGSLIYSKTPFLKRPPASTVKLLTAMVVMDRMSLGRTVKVRNSVEHIEPCKIYLKIGEKYRVRDLLTALLVSSANDAAYILAIAAAGSERRFVKLMNNKARRIGARYSRFTNPHGLPSKRRQYSTSYDLALIMKEAKRYRFIVNTLRKKRPVIRSRQGRKIYLKNHNKLLWSSKRFNVIGKTGFTRKAMYCFVGSIDLGRKEILLSMMGSSSLWRDVEKLIHRIFGQGNYKKKIRANNKLWPKKWRFRIQKALRRARCYYGPIDGIIGRKTINAIIKFQKNHGLSPDGIAGYKTWKKLKRFS